MKPEKYIQNVYDKAMQRVGSGNSIDSALPSEVQDLLQPILKYSESAKGVMTVVVTSLVYKALNPGQDIRKHQTSIEGGYSGRTFDTKHITPFLKSVKFPAMAETGWLTRSLEQKVPYDENYTGAVQPPLLKKAFLSTLSMIEDGLDCEEVLVYLFQGLILKRNQQQINLAKPLNLPISRILELLKEHFHGRYIADGASRLPTLALYAAYQCILSEVKRYRGKELLSLESHTSADNRSGRIGDIEIVDELKRPFEAVEVKHGIPISLQLVRDAFSKFATTQVNRYYLLSTSDVREEERESIELEIERIKNIHGCHIIANGLTKSLYYYLRLLNDPSDFIDKYVNLLEDDAALKYEHKKRWNEIVAGL